MINQFKINDDQNIFDIALQLYGNVEYAIKLSQDNPSALSSVTQTNITGLNIDYDPSVKVSNQITPIDNTPNITPLTIPYSVKDGQSIFDLALMLKGDIDKSYKLIQESGIANINKNILSGYLLNIDQDNSFLTSYINNKKITLNTSDPKIITGSGFDGGFIMSSFF